MSLKKYCHLNKEFVKLWVAYKYLIVLNVYSDEVQLERDLNKYCGSRVHYTYLKSSFLVKFLSLRRKSIGGRVLCIFLDDMEENVLRHFLKDSNNSNYILIGLFRKNHLYFNDYLSDKEKFIKVSSVGFVKTRNCVGLNFLLKQNLGFIKLLNEKKKKAVA